eukprot:422518_1
MVDQQQRTDEHEAGEEHRTDSSEWEDVTNAFHETATSLGEGELLRTPMFTLLDSLAALELMDPKMDRPTPSPVPLKDLIASRDLPLQVECQSLASVLDRLMVCEAAWLEGGPLQVTVFVCLYVNTEVVGQLLQLYREKNDSVVALTAAVLVARRCCALMRDFVVLADIHEEEDFFQSDASLNIPPLVDDDEIRCILRAAVSSLVDANERGVKGADRVLEHLVFRSALLETLLTLRKAFSQEAIAAQMQLMDAIRLQNLSHHNNSDDASSIMKSDVGSGNDEVASVVESDFVRISNDLKRKVELSTLENFAPLCGMRTALQHIKDALEAVNKISEGPEDDQSLILYKGDDNEGLCPISAFQMDYNHAFLDGYPHRDVTFLTVGDARLWWRKTIAGMSRACSLVDCNSLNEIRKSVKALSYPTFKDILLKKGGHPGANIVIRSIAAIYLFHRDMIKQGFILGKLPLEDVIAEYMVESGVPSSIIQCQASRKFLSQAAKPVYHSLMALVFNPGRRRNTLEGCLEDWGLMHAEAAVLDEAFSQQMSHVEDGMAHVGNWVMLEIFSIMYQHIRSGLQLNIYAPGELPAVFFYAKAILSAEIRLITEMQRTKALRAKMSSSQIDVDNGKEEAENVVVENRLDAMDELKTKCHDNDWSKKNSATTDCRAVRAKRLPSDEGIVSNTNEFQAEAYIELLQLWHALLEGSLHLICAIVMLVKQELANRGNSDDNEAYALYRVGCGVAIKPEIYAKRFFPFKCSVIPNILTYDDYCRFIQFDGRGAQELLKSGSELFSEAKMRIDRIRRLWCTGEDEMVDVELDSEGLLALKRVAVSNSVCALKLLAHSQPPRIKKIRYLFNIHPEVCVMEVDVHETTNK